VSLIKINTTLELINNFKGSVTVGTIVETLGYSTIGDGGGAKFTLQPSGYVALAGDVTLANGRVAQLQINSSIDLGCFGVKYKEELNQGALVQGAINRVRTQKDGGELVVSGQVFSSQTIYVWERVFIRGLNGMVLNWFQSDGTYDSKGAGFKLLPNSNVDLIKLAISANETAGATIPVESNVARRHGGGLSNMYLDGNRSETNDLTANDLNSAGRPLVCRGVNVVTIHDITVSRGAEHNVVFESNGLTDGSCNNMYIHRIYSQGSSQNGFSLSGGDTSIGFLWGIQNGLNGMTSSMQNSSFSSCIFNDNSQDGYFTAGANCSFIDVGTYDNRRNGVVITATNTSVLGGQSRHNGMNSGFSTTDRCGLSASSGATNLTIIGHKSYDDGYRGDPLDITQQRGYRITATDDGLTFEGNYAYGNVLSQIFSSAPIYKKCYGGGVLDAKYYSLSPPTTLSSITANTMDASRGLLTLNITGGATISSITNSDAGFKQVSIRNINTTSVTFTRSTSLATKSGVDLVLAQYSAVTFQEFSAGVWYEV
jgi:hypothetical protein